MIKDDNGDPIKKTWIAYKATGSSTLRTWWPRTTRAQAKLDDLILKAQGLNDIPRSYPKRYALGAVWDQLAKWVGQPKHGGSTAFYRASTDSIHNARLQTVSTSAKEAGYLNSTLSPRDGSQHRPWFTACGDWVAMPLDLMPTQKEELIAELGAFLNIGQTGWRSAPTLRIMRATCHLGSSVSKQSLSITLKALSEANKAANLIAPVTTITIEDEEA